MKFTSEELGVIMPCLSTELADIESRERAIRRLMAKVTDDAELSHIDKERLMDWCGLDIDSEDELSPVEKSLKDKLLKEV